MDEKTQVKPADSKIRAETQIRLAETIRAAETHIRLAETQGRRVEKQESNFSHDQAY